jgi:hypothetical protein
LKKLRAKGGSLEKFSVLEDSGARGSDSERSLSFIDFNSLVLDSSLSEFAGLTGH